MRTTRIVLFESGGEASPSAHRQTVTRDHLAATLVFLDIDFGHSLNPCGDGGFETADRLARGPAALVSQFAPPRDPDASTLGPQAHPQAVAITMRVTTAGAFPTRQAGPLEGAV